MRSLLLTFHNIIMSERTLHLWGKNYPLPTVLARRVLTASPGENHLLFATASGETMGLGSNKFGQLGLKEPQFYE